MKQAALIDIAKKRLVHQATRGRRAPKRYHFAKQQPPLAIGQSFAKQLLRLVAIMRADTIDAVGPLLRDWVRESDKLHGRMDGAANDAAATFAGIRLKLERGAFSSTAVKPLAQRAGETTAEFQKKQLQRQLSVAIGVQVPIFDKDLGGKVDAFTAENVGLIQSIPQQSLQQVQQVVLRGLAAGDRAEDLADSIQERFDVSESRAALIARDQTLKFFADLNRTRQQDLGITHFVWVTADTERTCDICEPLNGERFAWDQPPSEGLPGQVHPNCQCSADPDVEALLDDL